MAGGITTPELVAAVSNAGGLGMLAGSSLPPDQLLLQLDAVRALTDRPFGVNFLIAPPEALTADATAVQGFLDRFRSELDLPAGSPEVTLPPADLEQALAVVVEKRVPVVSFALGDPTPFVVGAKEAGSTITAMVTTVAEAEHVAAAGVDIVVAQGSEAGGHRSTLDLGPLDEPPLVGTLALVPQVVDAVDIPVVAAGGIGDGRGVAAVLALGAAGAQLGTRFLASRESGAFRAWKEALVAATETDTVVSRCFTGRPARALRNRLVEEFVADGPPPLAWPLQVVAAFDLYQAARERDDAGLYSLYSGQAVRLLRLDQPAGEIVEELVVEARERIGELAHSGL